MYANCPIHWASRLQTEITLSTVEAEYIALSSSLQEEITLITLMKELHRIFPVHITQPTFHCKVHEDNQSCIKMANSEKSMPRTKHIALKYHHFCSYIKKRRNRNRLLSYRRSNCRSTYETSFRCIIL